MLKDVFPGCFEILLLFGSGCGYAVKHFQISLTGLMSAVSVMIVEHKAWKGTLETSSTKLLKLIARSPSKRTMLRRSCRKW